MRRNNRGGGAQPWMQRPMASQGGPLMTDHLGLQDIDKELELLKRKREIIEQQQQILSNEFRRNDYQQPNYGQGHSRFDDYAQLYDEMRDFDAPSRKRPIPVWEDEIPTKRFSGPTRGSAKPRGAPRGAPRGSSRGPPRGSTRGPSRGSIRGSPRGSFAPRSGPSYQTARRPSPPKPERRSESKVTKPSGPDGRPDLPVPQHKKFVTDESSGYGRSDRLLEGVTPSKQMTGRMELALGHIIKEMKVTQEELVNMAVMRSVKQTIRDRIKELMMGKIIGSGESIRAKYREVYDPQSDHHFVAEAIAAQAGDLPVLKIDDPEIYFKRNMYKIMQMKLKSMLEKLEEQARAENPSAKLNATAEKKKEEEAESQKSLLDETIISTDKFRDLEKAMTAKLPFMLKKFLPYISKIMDIDGKYNTLKSNITNETVKKLRAKIGQKNAAASSNANADVSSKTSADASSKASFDVSMTSDNTSTPNDSLNTSTGPRANRPQLLYCKLMGKPALPKRKQMEQFFSEFQPKSIKKHRTLHNLLFVGFSDKESLDRILAADGTAIGRFKLSIRISERASEAPKKEDLDSSTDKLIGADLDEQITDLLTSIRKAEEEGENVTENADGTGPAENADANGTAENAGGNVTAENADGNVTAEKADGNVKTETDGNATAENADGNVTAETQNADENGTADNAGAATAEEVAHTNNEADVKVAETVVNVDDFTADDDVTFVEDAQINDVIDIADGPEQSNDADTKIVEDTTNGNDGAENLDTVQPLVSDKVVGKATPARASARLAATPSRIQTRRASRLAQND